jgi:hypothetical protein
MNQTRKNWLDYVSGLALIGSILILILLNILWGEHWIDSDMAAEMIFSKLLAEEGGIIASSNWYYSTEFRVLYTQLIMGPLHRIFTDWHVIRVITNVVFYVLMLFSFYFVCGPLKIRKRNISLCALALFVPVSEAVMTHLQMGNTYMSHVILCFVTFGLFLRLCDREQMTRKKRYITYMVIFAVICVILGISGVRYLLDLLVPMMLTAGIFVMRSGGFKMLREEPSWEHLGSLLKIEQMKYLFVSLGGLGLGGFGYVINAVFVSKQYQFQTYDATNFIVIHQGVFWDRVQNALGELLQMFGYIENKAFLSLRGVITMLAFVMIGTLGLVWTKSMRYSIVQSTALVEPAEQNHRRFTVLFAGTSFVLHIFVFVFTTSTMVDRYFIPIAIFFLLVLAVYMEWECLVFDRVVVCLILAGSLALAGVKTYYSFISNDKNADRYEMAEYLIEEGYQFGYASYWNSNIMTEVSDGALEMANLWSLETLGDFKWSSKMSSYEPKEGKIFLIAEKTELAALEEYGMLEQQEIIYKNDSYCVLHFDTQEEFLAYRKVQ